MTIIEQKAEAAKRALTSSRARSGTAIVSAGYVLLPPFTASYQKKGDELEFEIKGSDNTGTIKIICNDIVLSPFRTRQITFLSLAEEGKLLGQRTVAFLTEAYLKILEAFPPGSVFNSKQLYAKVLRADGEQQSHARRRWKEIKYDYGFDVDFDKHTQMYISMDVSFFIEPPKRKFYSE